MNRQQSLGGGARGFSLLKGKNLFTLAEGATHVDMFGNYRKRAFTLAEVLITLGIIGVVAAMTMPTLMTKYRKHVAANRAKQVYTELSQVLQLARVKYGDMDSWDFTSRDTVKKYILEFYKGLTLCQEPNGVQISKRCGMSISGNNPIYATSRGEGISFSANNTSRKSINIFVDTDAGNGKNRLGTDVFYFEMKNNRLMPYGWKDEITRDEIKNGYYVEGANKQIACKNEHIDGGYQRNACTSLLMFDGWEFKDDYPW